MGCGRCRCERKVKCELMSTRFEASCCSPINRGLCLELARSVRTQRIWPYIWWYPCQKHRSTPYTPCQGCSVRFLGSTGSIKFVKVLQPSNCLKGLMCNFGKRALGLLPPPSNLPIRCVYYKYLWGGKWGQNGIMSSL